MYPLKHGRYVTDILEMYMKTFNAEKIIFDKFTEFHQHISGVYCKPCLQPISR